MFNKLLTTMSKNLGYTIIMVIATVFFFYFLEYLIPGVIAAAAAVIIYACGSVLCREYRLLPDVKKTVAKPVSKSGTKKSATAKKTSAHKKK